jgi:peptide/nickel transport system substrate-binding protein
MTSTRRGQVFLMTICLAALPFALAACGSGATTTGGSTAEATESGSATTASQTETGHPGGEIVWGKATEAEDLDPASAGTALSWEITSLAYERLVGMNEEFEVVPKLAESWKQTSPTTYVFKLRPGVKFSNGREMSVEDVVGSLNRAAEPERGLWQNLSGVKKVSAAGPDEVKIELNAPRTAFLPSLAVNYASILPMKELKDGSFDPKKELLGTGPFEVESHRPGESWTFGRNPYYYVKGEPKAEKLTIKIMPDDSARIAALRNGSIDVTTFETPDAVPLLEGEENVEALVQGTTDFFTLDVNATTSIFKSPVAREALSLALDREEISEIAMGGTSEPSAAAAPAFKGVCEADAMPFATPDPAAAKEKFEEAGLAGKEINILVTNEIGMTPQIGQVIQQQLEAAGLKVKIESMTVAQLVERAWNGTATDFDLTLGWFLGYNDPAMVMTFWTPEPGDFNEPWMIPDPELTAWVKKATETPAGSARSTALKEACTAIDQDANLIPLVTRNVVVASRSDQIEAPVASVDGFGIPFDNIAEFQVK